jgi:hypothetical protein
MTVKLRIAVVYGHDGCGAACVVQPDQDPLVVLKAFQQSRLKAPFGCIVEVDVPTDSPTIEGAVISDSCCNSCGRKRGHISGCPKKSKAIA